MSKANEVGAFNVRTGARYIGVSAPTFLKLLPELPHRRVGKRVVIAKAVLDRWLEGELQGGEK